MSRTKCVQKALLNPCRINTLVTMPPEVSCCREAYSAGIAVSFSGHLETEALKALGFAIGAGV
jgi:hypothetical protein